MILEASPSLCHTAKAPAVLSCSFLPPFLRHSCAAILSHSHCTNATFACSDALDWSVLLWRGFYAFLSVSGQRKGVVPVRLQRTPDKDPGQPSRRLRPRAFTKEHHIVAFLRGRLVHVHDIHTLHRGPCLLESFESRRMRILGLHTYMMMTEAEHAITRTSLSAHTRRRDVAQYTTRHLYMKKTDDTVQRRGEREVATSAPKMLRGSAAL